MTTAGGRYYDRRDGLWKTERVFAGAFLHWLYNTRAGGLVCTAITASPWPSRLYGRAHRGAWSRRKVRRFVEALGVDTSEALKPLDAFPSFADFFVREIDLRQRPVHPEPDVCIAPADGKVLAFARVEAGTRFAIKRSWFDLAGLLRDAALTRTFAGGAMVVSRLCLADYHHFHFPVAGLASAARPIPGSYHAGGPYALRTLVPFFTENHRMLTTLASDRFGLVGMVEIGALTVGSIRQTYRPETRVARGERKGRFELGGSTVVLLFEPGAIALDADLVSLTAEGTESYVRMGESIGRGLR